MGGCSVSVVFDVYSGDRIFHPINLCIIISRSVVIRLMQHLSFINTQLHGMHVFICELIVLCVLLQLSVGLGHE